MISYYFDGGLANICLQICATFFYCRKYNIDFSNIKFNKNSIRNLCNYNIVQYPILQNIEFFDNISYSLEDNLYIDTKRMIDICCVQSKLTDVVFCGYHFPNIDETIKNLDLFKDIFYNKELFDNVIKEYKDIIDNSYGIQIRRTDFLYLNPKGVLTLNEINNKIEINKNRNILIFSDDMKWCQDNITKQNNIYFINNDKPYKDLILMSVCKDYFMNPSSTFSWFGFKYLSLIFKEVKI